MNKVLRNTALFLPLLALVSCGPTAPKEDLYKPSAEEWTANIERIKTGNMQVTFSMNMGELGNQTVIMKATATKVQQDMTISGVTMTELVVKDGEDYFSYSKMTRTSWVKNPTTAEHFIEVKDSLLPMTLEYSNFEWNHSKLTMNNKQPIVVVDGDGDTTTFTNVSINVPSKQISMINADVSSKSGETTQTGSMKATYTYKDTDFDIEVPEVNSANN